LRYCYSLGWTVVAINLDSAERRLFKQQKFSSLPIGREATIDTEQFIQGTLNSKHFRYVNNRSKRDQLTVTEWNELSEERIQQLQTISKTWLKQGNRREYTFFMGYFDRSYLKKSRVFVLFQSDEPVAFVNILPSRFGDRQSIDLFRSTIKTSPIGMYFLFEEMIKKLSSEGIQYLNIGLAPLSTGSEDPSASRSSALRLLRRFGFYYSFKGVEQFKNKFKPKWETRYIAYSGSPANLLRVVKDVEYVSSYKTRGDRLVYITTIVGIAVFSVGLYFILN
jgi:phosphatidylglycerol lysyltransferase